MISAAGPGREGSRCRLGICRSAGQPHVGESEGDYEEHRLRGCGMWGTGEETCLL